MGNLRIVTRQYSWRFRVNTPLTWRERLGEFLRSLASRIDGRYSVGLQVTTDPPLSPRQMECVFKEGWVAMQRVLEVETRAEAEEAVFRELNPALFEVPK